MRSRALLDDWISIFGPIECVLSDGGLNLVSEVLQSMTDKLGVGRIRTYPLHPQANGTV